MRIILAQRRLLTNNQRAGTRLFACIRRMQVACGVPAQRSHSLKIAGFD
jgi:hypothetical protein